MLALGRNEDKEQTVPSIQYFVTRNNKNFIFKNKKVNNYKEGRESLWKYIIVMKSMIKNNNKEKRKEKDNKKQEVHHNSCIH